MMSAETYFNPDLKKKATTNMDTSRPYEQP